ncbi:MAG: hypothetical protein H0X37_18350 [Herpetosiphonaceae bacterium]|nr:hypothetical protein [Herpetosiphonaceae bacterium]
MPASNGRNRPVMQTTGIKIGLTVAAIGASVAGWAAMGIAQEAGGATVAQASDTTQSATLPAPPVTDPAGDAVVAPPSIDVAPAPLPQFNTFSPSGGFGRPQARTRSSR